MSVTRFNSSVFRRLWGFVLAIAVASTVISFASLTGTQPAQAAPPKVGDPDRLHSLGVPSDSGRAVSGSSDGYFRAYEIWDGIAVADSRTLIDDKGDFLPAEQWPAEFTAEEWQYNIDVISGHLDKLAATKDGMAVLDAMGSKLKPLPGGKGNQWVDWSSGSAGGPSEIQTVIFPTKGEGGAAGGLSVIDQSNNIGSALAIQYDPDRYTGYYDPETGVRRTMAPMDTLGHEGVHGGAIKLGACPSRDKTVDVLENEFQGDSRDPAPQDSLGADSVPLPESEVLAHGGDEGLDFFLRKQKKELEAKILKAKEEGADEGTIEALNEKIKNLSTKTNSYLNDSAQFALDYQTEVASPELQATTRGRLDFARINPTEVKISEQLGNPVRREYLTGVYLDSGTNVPKYGGVFGLADGVSRDAVTKADLEAPMKSGKFIAKAAGPIPICGGGHDSCLPDGTQSKPVTEEEVKAQKERVKARVELEKGRTSESVFFEALSVEDLQVLAGMGVSGSPEMVRDSFTFAPEGSGGVGTPELNEVLGSKGFAELNSRGEGPHVGGGGGLPFNEVLALGLVLQTFGEDSTVLNQAAALLAPVPLIGQVFWFAAAIEGGDETNVAAASLALASAGIEAGLGLAGLFGVEAGAVMAGLSALASTLGLVSLVVVGVSIFVSLVKTKGWGWIAEHSNPATWFVTSFIHKQPGAEAGPESVPDLEWTHNDPYGKFGGAQNGHNAWTNDYVRARTANAYLLWAEEYSKSHTQKLIEAMERKFRVGQKTVIYNGLLAQGAAERVGAINGDRATDIEAAKATIRTKTAESLAALKAGMIEGVKKNHAVMVGNLNKGAGFNEFKASYFTDRLIPEYTKEIADVCATFRENQDAAINDHDNGYEKHKVWDELTQNYSRYGQCAEGFWTPELFTAKFTAPTEAVVPYAPAEATITERITATVNGTGHAPAATAVGKTKEAADKANEFRTHDSTPSQVAESINTTLGRIAETGKELEKTVSLLPSALVSAPEVTAAYAAVTKAHGVFTGYKENPVTADTGYLPESNLAAMVTAVDALKVLADKSPGPAFALAQVPASKPITTTALAWSIESPVSSTPAKNTGQGHPSMTLVNGFGPAGKSVAVKYQDGNTVCTAIVTHLGIWACKLSAPLKPGHELSLSQNDRPVDGIKITVPGIRLTIDKESFQDPIDTTTLENSLLQWGGQGTPGNKLTATIFCDNPGQRSTEFTLPEITVDSKGIWTYKPRSSNMLENTSCSFIVADKTINDFTYVTFKTTGTKPAPGPAPAPAGVIEAENAVLADGATTKENYAFKDGKVVLENTTVTGGTITFNETHIKAPTTPGFYNVTIEYKDPGTTTHPDITKNNEPTYQADFPGSTESSSTLKTIATTLYLDQTTRKLKINLQNTPNLHINKITINQTPNP